MSAVSSPDRDGAAEHESDSSGRASGCTHHCDSGESAQFPGKPAVLPPPHEETLVKFDDDDGKVETVEAYPAIQWE